MKRIGFLISKQHLIPHGGIGQFSKGFAEMCERLGFFVDIIVDEVPDNYNPLHEQLMQMDNVNVVYPTHGGWGGTRHQKIHAFSETINFEKVTRFRDCIMEAMQKNLYDAFLVNTPEALFSVYALGIQEYVNVIFYTHNENLVFKDNTFKGVFNDVYDPMIDAFMRLPGITIGTQTERNVSELNSASAWHLPMPIPERDLLKSSRSAKKEGVLFIGRWEERKGPKEFIKLIEDTGLPAKVMTNSNGAKKFKEALEAIGAKYEIKQSIVGKEKVDFIKSAKVFFMPSKSESYGFALMECLGHCPCVVLSKYNWHDNFLTTKNLFRVSQKEAASLVKDLHDDYQIVDSDDGLEYIKKIDAECDETWRIMFEQFKGRQSTSSSATITSRDDLFYSDYIESLGRFASVEDVVSVLGNRHRFNVLYDKTSTYLSKTKTSLPKKPSKVSLDDLF